MSEQDTNDRKEAQWLRRSEDFTIYLPTQAFLLTEWITLLSLLKAVHIKTGSMLLLIIVLSLNFLFAMYIGPAIGNWIGVMFIPGYIKSKHNIYKKVLLVLFMVLTTASIAGVTMVVSTIAEIIARVDI